MNSFFKKAYNRIFYLIMDYIDFLKYKRLSNYYRRIIDSPVKNASGKSLLIVSGRGMNIVWAQIWSIYSIVFFLKGYRRFVLTGRNQKNLNRYYRLLGIIIIYFEDFEQERPVQLSSKLLSDIEALTSFSDFKSFQFDGMPVGQIALSTYSRHLGTGDINISKKETALTVKNWMEHICKSYKRARVLYSKYNIESLFFTEVFMEEYGALYYAALHDRLNVIRFAGTVRDNAIIIQHLNIENDRSHHASISNVEWQKIKQSGITPKIDAELKKNFSDRYGKKWHRSYRNHPDTKIIDVDEAKNDIGIKPGRKVAIIFSHILYDTLFFFGSDLYQSYADWLLNTIKVAIKNDNIEWVVKVHPSNIWRGELTTLLKGKYEEERLIASEFGELPDHIHIVGADTKINPYTWFQLGDYCITVRGTSGLEMATLGKCVVTAGTGRYDNKGFTIDSNSVSEYEALLLRLHTEPEISNKKAELAKLYAHALFVRKPFEMQSMNAVLRTGKSKMVASDDIIYLPSKNITNKLPNDLDRFLKWATENEVQDLLS